MNRGLLQEHILALFSWDAAAPAHRQQSIR
jgi:hypothetical protein